MAAKKEIINPERLWPWWRLIMLGLNLLALVLSVILSWHFLKGGSMAGCGGGSPCEQVLNSRWSSIAGIFPISGLAMGVYLALLVAGFFIGPASEASIRRLAWKVMLILAGAITGSAVWFTIVQKWIIGSFCPYCMTAHVTGMLLSVLIIWQAIRIKNSSSRPDEQIISPLPAMGLLLAGLVLAGSLVLFQSAFTPPVVYHDGESQEQLAVIDLHDAPIVGSPDAPYVVTLLFDYQCSHCQKIHFMLNEVVRRYDGKLAFALCPTPLNNECNPFVPKNSDAFRNSCELARIGLAVFVASPGAYPAFEDWMFTYESGDRWQPRSPESARARASELVGPAAFETAWSDPRVEKYMETCVRIYGQTIQEGKGGIPKMVFGSHWIIPEPSDTDDLIMILQKSLGVPGL